MSDLRYPMTTDASNLTQSHAHLTPPPSKSPISTVHCLSTHSGGGGGAGKGGKRE